MAARAAYRVPSNAHAVDTSTGRTLAPGETISASDLTLSGKDEAAVAHDQRLVDEVLIDLGDPPAAKEPTAKELQARAAELNIEGRSDMDKDALKAAIAEAEAEQAGGDS